MSRELSPCHSSFFQIWGAILKYRAEIDGLRSLAVIPVILFHAGLDIFSGGFIGVDIFFVISGYLITTIIIEDIENQRFSLAKFYERRARRILPALTVVMIACLPFSWILLSDAALERFGSGLIATSLFVSNLFFWRQQGYFEESADVNPILHTWSLGVEEQYYIFFPIYLIAAWRWGKSWVFWGCLAMAIISFSLSNWAVHHYPNANFYSAPTRAWEIFVGSVAAFCVKRRGLGNNNLLASLGLGIIVFSIGSFDEKTPWPSIYTLAPVIAVFLLLRYASDETFVAQILSKKLFVGLGLISYSAYLWHQPVFAFFRIYTNQLSISGVHASVLVIIIFMLSIFSWRFVEIPFRRDFSVSRGSVVTLSLGAMIVLILAGYASMHATTGFEYRLAKKLSESDFVYFENLDERKFVEGRLLYPLEPVTTVVVGSSRVMQIDSEIVGEKIQSFTVSGASIEDDIAFSLESFAKLRYENLYIAADPWLINLYDEQNRYQSVGDLFEYWSGRMLSNEPPRRFLTALPKDVESHGWRNVVGKLRDLFSVIGVNRIPSNDVVEGYAKKAYDGSHIYNHETIRLSENAAVASEQFLNYSMMKFEFDIKSIERLTQLLSYLKEHEVRVTLILVPYHPDLYQKMLDERPIFLEVESWFRDFASQNGIEIVGSYNAGAVGCEDRDFYDGMHPKASCMKKLFNRPRGSL